MTTSDDVVVLSGWARVPDTHSEAELMRAAWRGQAREVVVDPDARTTVDNMANAMNDVLRVGAKEVLVVTSVVARPACEGGAPLAAPLDRDPRAGGVTAGRSRGASAPRAAALAAPAVPALVGGSEELGAVASSPGGFRRSRIPRLDPASGGAPLKASPSAPQPPLRPIAPSLRRHLDVDPLLRLAQRAAVAGGADGEDLGEDRERRLGLGVGADVEAARPLDPRERLLRDAGLEEPLAAPLLVRREPSAPM